MANDSTYDQRTLFGHPVGLYTLFFAEMWERFSFYGMRALLVLYMVKGFLGYGDDKAYRVYGAYAALVYMAPFFGGLIADRILGSRRSVILGGLLMAAGHLMMTVEGKLEFYAALALIICGNGFFKPNISTLVGSLYPERSKLRDGGFTIFYIGINLGAALSPLLCGYVGENYGWHRGFGLATIGMLAGLAVFVAPNVWSQLILIAACFVSGYNLFGHGAGPEAASLTVTLNWVTGALLASAGIVSFLSLASRRDRQHTVFSTALNMFMIGGGSLAAAYGMLRLYKLNSKQTLFHELGELIKENAGFIEIVVKASNVFVTACLLVAAAVACIALARGGLPVRAGEAREPERLRQRVLDILPLEWVVYLGALLCVPVFMLFVSGFDPLDQLEQPISIVRFVGDEAFERLGESDNPLAKIAHVFLGEFGSPAGLMMLVASIIAAIYIALQMGGLDKIARDRMKVAIILIFFSLLFWSLFEQGGSSLNNFADRNIDRVTETRRITEDDVGEVVEIEPTQEQLGFPLNREMFTLTDLTKFRDDRTARADATISWALTEEHIGMGIAPRRKEIAASTLQAINPVFILIFGLVFTAIWSLLGSYEPSTPFKFALGILQVGIGFGAIWYGTVAHDARGMVWMGWLFLGYLFHTTGELCLSPVGLSMITKLSAKQLVSTMMGTWFLATAVSEFLAGTIAQFTKVDTNGTIPPPIETVGKYGGVYGTLALVAIISAGFCFALVPWLKRWMHEDKFPQDES